MTSFIKECGGSCRNAAKLASSKWKALEENEKLPYIDESAAISVPLCESGLDLVCHCPPHESGLQAPVQRGETLGTDLPFGGTCARKWIQPLSQHEDVDFGL